MTNGKKCVALFDTVIRVLYLLLFPAMMVILSAMSLVLKSMGFSVRFYGGWVNHPLYRFDFVFCIRPVSSGPKRQAQGRKLSTDMERAAQKDVELREKALAKLRKKQEKAAKKEERRKQKLKQS